MILGKSGRIFFREVRKKAGFPKEAGCY